jgi:hypothetical protein
LDTPTSFYEFWKFETISRIYLNKKGKRKGLNSAWAESGPRLQRKARWRGTRGQPEGRLGHGLAAGPAADAAHALHARGGVVARLSAARWWLASGNVLV